MSENQNKPNDSDDGAQGIVPLSDATELVEVGDKSIPLLTFPDGSTIHLMPWSMGDEHQNPVVILERWLREWMKVPFDLLSDSHKDIGEWLQVVKYIREANEESSVYGMPNEVGIKVSERLRDRMAPAFRSYHR